MKLVFRQKGFAILGDSVDGRSDSVCLINVYLLGN